MSSATFVGGPWDRQVMTQNRGDLPATLDKIDVKVTDHGIERGVSLVGGVYVLEEGRRYHWRGEPKP